MEASFFYKLTSDASDFETIQFEKPEISISALKELIIKDKFEESISLKELDIIDFTSRKSNAFLNSTNILQIIFLQSIQILM